VAADRLADRLAGEGSPDQIKVVLTVELVERQTTASARLEEVRA
jgi:DNA-binding LacI/PurR family transcriptional regulator